MGMNAPHLDARKPHRNDGPLPRCRGMGRGSRRERARYRRNSGCVGENRDVDVLGPCARDHNFHLGPAAREHLR